MIKFTFIPERQLTTKEQMVTHLPTATIYVNGQLTFSREFINLYPMDGKYVRFFVDTMRRTIGWLIIDGNTDMASLNDARLIKANNVGVCKASIKKLLYLLGWEEGNSIFDLPIKLYKSPMISGDIHYITLPDKVVELNSENIITKEELKATQAD